MYKVLNHFQHSPFREQIPYCTVCQMLAPSSRSERTKATLIINETE